MKKLLTLLLFIVVTTVYSQDLRPTLGINYSGGITYGMDAELFSVEAGVLYTPDQAGKFHDQDTFINGIETSFTLFYDFYPKQQNKKYTYYLAKITFSHPISDWWNVVAYGGYANNFTNNIMWPYSGKFKTNLSYGGGFEAFDNHVVGKLLFEELAGYPRINVGIAYKFNKIKF